MSPVRKRSSTKALGGFARPVPIALVTFGPLMRISPTSPVAAPSSDRRAQTTSSLDAGQRQPDRARLVRPVWRMAGAGRAGLGHAPAALELHADLALEEASRPRPAAARRRSRMATSEEKSRLSRSGRLAIAIHIVGTPRKSSRASPRCRASTASTSKR